MVLKGLVLHPTHVVDDVVAIINDFDVEHRHQVVLPNPQRQLLLDVDVWLFLELLLRAGLLRGSLRLGRLGW